MNYAIEIDHLTKSYGKNRGVIDVSLRVKEGDIFGFIGPNGAGKSTTIRSMLGFLKFQQGNITILGKDSVRQREEILKDVGYMPSEAWFSNDCLSLFVIIMPPYNNPSSPSHFAILSASRTRSTPISDWKRFTAVDMEN